MQLKFNGLPYNSTDLSLVDYKMWAEMQQLICHIHDVDELKHSLIIVWYGFMQSVIDDVVDKRCKCRCA